MKYITDKILETENIEYFRDEDQLVHDDWYYIDLKLIENITDEEIKMLETEVKDKCGKITKLGDKLRNWYWYDKEKRTVGINCIFTDHFDYYRFLAAIGRIKEYFIKDLKDSERLILSRSGLNWRYYGEYQKKKKGYPIHVWGTEEEIKGFLAELNRKVKRIA